MSKSNKGQRAPRGYCQSICTWIDSFHWENYPAAGRYRKYQFKYAYEFSLPQTLDEIIHWKFRKFIPKTRNFFIADIPNGRIWGSKGAVITPDDQLLWDVSREKGKKPISHSIFSQRNLPPLTSIAENVAVVTQFRSRNYFHWLFDVLPRLIFLRENEMDFGKFVLDRPRTFPFHEQTLAYLDIPHHHAIDSHDHLHLKAKRLIVPSIGEFPRKWACDFLRDRLLDEKPNARSSVSRRIYISRARASRRNVTNEEAVFQALEKRGFKKVILESLSVAKQIQLFSSAEIIVAPHGAGLANLAFCQPGTKVIEFFSPNCIRTCFWEIASYTKLDYYYLIGEGTRPPDFVDPQMGKDDITIDIGRLLKLLKMSGLKDRK